MDFIDKYLDVLQNIETAIVTVYQDYPELSDHEVSRALEALIDHYTAQKIGRSPRNFSLTEREAVVFDQVQLFCDWRLGLVPETEMPAVPPKSVDEIIQCLKRILKSVHKWNKEGGRQGYLNFVSQFIPG